MCESYTIHQHKVIWTLATGTMTNKVELWYHNTNGEFIKIKIEGWEISAEAAMEIDAPLASNVICNKKLTDTCIEVVYN